MVAVTEKRLEALQEILTLTGEINLALDGIKGIVLSRAGYQIDERELDEILSGKGDLALTKLVIMSLKEEQREQQSLSHPDIISVGEVSSHSEESIMIYTVKASSAEDAIQKLSSSGVNIHGYRNESDYDCSGQWCAAPLTERDAIEIPHTGVWVLKHWWSLDV